MDTRVSAHIIPASQFTTKKWASGETTELLIFPPGSSLEARNFDCRLSTASVMEDGPFTPFEGYERILTLLNGEGMNIQVNDENHDLVKPYQQLSFSGDDDVSATLHNGPISDLNLIFKNSLGGRVNAKILSPDTEVDLPLIATKKRHPLYRLDMLWAPTTSFRVNIETQAFIAKPGDLFILIQSDPAAIGQLNVYPDTISGHDVLSIASILA